jgi:hypothetical protein
MWKLFKRKNKNIDTSVIKNFNNALKIIEEFIALEEFEKAERSIVEIKNKENISFQEYIETVKEENKKVEIDKFRKNIWRIEKLKEKLDKNRKEYDKKIKERKKIFERKEIEKDINDLIWKKSFIEASNLLNEYIEKDPNNFEIINYASKKRKDITKHIEKEKKNKEKEIKNNAILEAKSLIWELQYTEEKKNEKKKSWFFDILKWWFNIRKKLKEKRLIEEITLLIENQNNKNDSLARKKLEQVHLWLSKEISWEKINWYELYGKILWADKISWDALWFMESKKNYNFFIWDATWHWIKAWMIISNLTKRFNDNSKKEDLKEIVQDLNNALKQDLKSWNFITSIFFNINKIDNKELKIVWMWHEPMFVYRYKTKEVEKIIPWWLAAWIRIIKDISSLKEKYIILEDKDILLSYTDWIVECKNADWEMYSINRVWEKFLEFARNEKYSLQDIYDSFKNDLKAFSSWKLNYLDDVTIMLLKRDKNKEILESDEEINKIIEKEWLIHSYKKKIKWKTLEEIRDDIKKIQNENVIRNIIKWLDNLYKSWEITRLKQDSIRYIKEWHIHSKINFYLKKAIDNENSFKIKQKEKKIQDKYNVLKELYKKWDHETVIYECSNIISKDGNI